MLEAAAGAEPEATNAAVRIPALTVRAAAVTWRGHAILCPGAGGIGTSTLARALVRAGATMVADGRVRLSADGLVTGPAADQVRSEALPLRLVVSTAFSTGVSWTPDEVVGPRAAFPILENVVGQRVERTRLFRLTARLLPILTTLTGARPEADAVAPQILKYLDELIDGAPPSRAEAGVPDLLEERMLLLLHWHGRFGNRMHQYAYGVTYARLNGCRLVLPSEWEGTELFAGRHHDLLPRGRLRNELNRHGGKHSDPEHRRSILRRHLPNSTLIHSSVPSENYRRHETPAAVDDMCAYHPSIFSAMSRSHLLSVFGFSERVKRLDLYKRLEDRQGTYDIAHLRRDDVSNPNYNRTHVQGYSVVSKESYYAAFAEFGFDPNAVEWVSDDRTGKWHPDRAPQEKGRWRYPNGSEILPNVLFDWLGDFLRLYFARTIFRANSSFSWWAGFLSPSARVFSPVLDRRHIYGVDGMEEITVRFVEGNHPHWMYGNQDIVIGD